MKNKEKPFYVYVHKYASGPKQGQVFYVGKGKGRRAWVKQHRSAFWKRISLKYGIDISIIARFSKEECAFSFEKALINYYGINNLCNMTYGGEGVSGYKFDRNIVIEKAKKCNKQVINSSGNVFASLKDAAKFCRDIGYKNAVEGHISSCCNGKRWVAYGFSWSFDISKRPDLVDASSKVNINRLRPVAASNGKVFPSVTSARDWVRNSLKIKCGSSDISKCCNGLRKQCGGLSWSYV